MSHQSDVQTTGDHELESISVTEVELDGLDYVS